MRNKNYLFIGSLLLSDMSTIFSLPHRNVISSKLKKELKFILGMVAPAHKPSTWKDEEFKISTGYLFSEFKTSLGYMRQFCKLNKTKNK